jgi:hypothetical protein
VSTTPKTTSRNDVGSGRNTTAAVTMASDIRYSFVDQTQQDKKDFATSRGTPQRALSKLSK